MCAPPTNAANGPLFSFFVSVSLEHVCREVPCSRVRVLHQLQPYTRAHTHRGAHTRDGLALRVVELAYGSSCDAQF